ncbi:MAG: TldD/PmbA family protein, partial [Nitrososphaerota archaeon]|nr:TldD/PmbA family protein [Nitrososphaerota archaeon]
MSEDLALRALREALRLGASYVEVRYQEGFATSLRIRKGIVESSSTSAFKGMGIRVLKNGSWGFASLEDLTMERILEAAVNAVKLASSSSSSRSRKVELAETKPIRDRVKTSVLKIPYEVSIEEKLKIVFDADRAIWSKGEKIVDNAVTYSDFSGKKLFINSEGTEIEMDEIRTYFAVQASAREMDRVSPAYEAIGGTVGFELIEKNDIVKIAEDVASRAIRLLSASIPKGGLATCVLDNDILGLLIHEAFGHTAEADLVLSGSVLTSRIGEQVASEYVTIIDSPEPVGANGWIPYDDEGVRAKPVKIVEKGVLKGFMHNRESAAVFGVEPTGNARAQSYSHTPLIRMRNTYMEAGDWNYEEIIRETKEGFYLKGGLGGQADSNGEFMFSIQEAWRIENGELVEPFRGVTISGNAIEVLKSIDAVGGDLKIESPGNCGKFQWVPVDNGGPHVRAKMIIGGS